jgi:hypothetical protein
MAHCLRLHCRPEEFISNTVLFRPAILYGTNAACDDDAPGDNSYVDPPQFTLRSLMAATGNFAAKNKLGGEQERTGDLGPVFKVDRSIARFLGWLHIVRAHSFCSCC